MARSASAMRVPRPGPYSMSRTRSGDAIFIQTSAHQAPSNSPNIWLISGAVVKSPAAPGGNMSRLIRNGACVLVFRISGFQA